MTLNKLEILPHCSLCRLWSAIFVLVLMWSGFGIASVAEDQEELLALRKIRRQASKEIQTGKTILSSPSKFGLLVIPVDFDGTRLPANWKPGNSLSSQMFGADGQTMENYFNVASDGKMELQITIAPLVHLNGNRESYSDIGWNGFYKTRALATEAITSVASQGIEFRRLDLDGPDGLPSSGDDDGQVDGVLILHSGPGQENDTEDGLIQPLQFFIEPPVESGGVQASFYAVASLQSGLGIWAHETGHLLGMEDRYDPLLHPETGGVDVRSLGGLGRFSLMSSGAWGTGGGQNPALPDAYTCWQLGWTSPQRYPLADNPLCTVSSWRGGGESPVTVWSSGHLNSEFLLLETRDPESTAPFDLGLPQGQMLVYHVDETVPEGWYLNEENSGYHLRVRLIEADHDFDLANGFDDGRAEDSFPGPLGISALTPLTVPNSGGYLGTSNVSLEEITSDGHSVTCRMSDSPEDHVINLSFRVATEGEEYLDIQVSSLADGMDNLTCVLTIEGEGGGSFPDGTTSQEFSLSENSGLWTPTEQMNFVIPTNPVAGAVTSFHYIFNTDGEDLPEILRPWVWLSDASTLDFNNPDWIFWEQEFPNLETNTRWHLWDQAPFLTADGNGVLACTGEEFSNSGNWPEVQYGRRGRAALISPALGEDVHAIQLTHAIEVEYLHAGTVMDGASVFWQGPDGELFDANPVDGWDAVISPQSNNTLGGANVFADSSLVLNEENLPQWRCDVLPLPTSGQGPWRLRLEFSSNYTWRLRGWFVAEIKALGEVPFSAFPVSWETSGRECPAGLNWSFPNSNSEFNDPVVEYFDLETRQFTAIPNQDLQIFPCASGFVMPREFILDFLVPSGFNRHLLRVSGNNLKGTVASRSVVVYPDSGPRNFGTLEQPFPNPSSGSIKFLVDIPTGKNAVLKIFDLRGRLVHTRECLSGRYQVFWDGFDDSGRRLAAGTYYLKLDGSGFSSMRKVVLIR